ncbi:MAG: endonuclease/exonuclease/phosphatase family protein [Bacteroidales bacterium]|nr:endonuclease/exonuclease/phosphatase family protein [Bacteroidales bacterium]
MKALLSLLLLLPWSLFAQDEDRLTVASFNVRFLDDNRPEYDYKFGGQPWSVRRPAVKAFFLQNDIDVAGLQEVRRTQAADLEEDLGDEWFIYCPGRLSGGRMVRTSDESTGVMYRKSRFKLLDHGCFWLSDTPAGTASLRKGQNYPIITSWLHLEDKKGEQLWFFSAHISWSVDENPELPDQEVETLLSEMEKLTGLNRADFRTAPIFLVGDLNNSPEKSAIQTLKGRFRDARTSCPETESTERKTFHNWGKEKGSGIIDYIFYGTGKPLEYIVDNTSYAPEVKYLSDHYPILLRLSRTPDKYCLTPQAPARPRYNGPAVLGARPGRPIYFRLPFSGQRPMKFSACRLPKGLKLDRSSGVVSGSVDKAGDYTITWKAQNKAGCGKGKMVLKIGDTIALTPPMGWNSWNCWGLEVSQEKVQESARALISSGLADYGYSYINIDDAWQASERSADGTLLPNDRFQDIAALGDWLHSNGLKLGIYSSPGDRTCGGYLGSLGHERQDANTWNSWGVDYLKYDLCGYRSLLKEMPTVGKEEHMKPYLLMKEALLQQPRDIVYSICQYGLEDVWTWGEEAGGNLWRTTGDLWDKWERVVRIGFVKQRPAVSYSGPGHWNDPDMLVIGKVGWGEGLRDSRLSADEQYSHVSQWALLAAPLMIGGDLSCVDEFTLNLLCNNEVIAVDQDPLGKQADCLWEDETIQIWGRPLSDGSCAAGIFNLGERAVETDIPEMLSKAGYPNARACRDLWRQEDCPDHVCIPSHGVILVKYYAE